MLTRNARVLAMSIGLFAAAALSGCAANLFPGGPSVAGMVYTDVTDPAQHLAVALDGGASGSKMGTSSSSAFLGIVALGDSSLHAAMKAGRISRVHHVDHQVQLVLGGIWAKTTTIVYGD